MTCLPGVVKIIGLLTQYHWPVLRELSPGSPALNDLERDTLARIASNEPTNIAVAHEVIWAELEKVVIPGQFCDDPAARIAQQRDHITVCKMTDQYELALQRVTAALN
jgi:hypothetical protein